MILYYGGTPPIELSAAVYGDGYLDLLTDLRQHASEEGEWFLVTAEGGQEIELLLRLDVPLRLDRDAPTSSAGPVMPMRIR